MCGLQVGGSAQKRRTGLSGRLALHWPMHMDIHGCMTPACHGGIIIQVPGTRAGVCAARHQQHNGSTILLIMRHNPLDVAEQLLLYSKSSTGGPVGKQRCHCCRLHLLFPTTAAAVAVAQLCYCWHLSLLLLLYHPRLSSVGTPQPR